MSVSVQMTVYILRETLNDNNNKIHFQIPRILLRFSIPDEFHFRVYSIGAEYK